VPPEAVGVFLAFFGFEAATDNLDRMAKCEPVS
jgi:hypothetical protein